MGANQSLQVGTMGALVTNGNGSCRSQINKLLVIGSCCQCTTIHGIPHQAALPPFCRLHPSVLIVPHALAFPCHYSAHLAVYVARRSHFLLASHGIKLCACYLGSDPSVGFHFHLIFKCWLHRQSDGLEPLCASRLDRAFVCSASDGLEPPADFAAGVSVPVLFVLCRRP